MRKLVALLVGCVALLAAVGVATPLAFAEIASNPPDPLKTYPHPPGDIVLWGGGEAIGINDAGTIVGITPEDGSLAGTAFTFDPATHVMNRLGTYGDSGQDSIAEAVNDAGVTAGQVTLTDVNYFSRAAIWTSPWVITLIPNLGGNTAAAHDINDAGVVVGDSTVDEDDMITHAFATGPSGTVDVGVLAGGVSSTAAAVNEDGLVVGTSEIGGTAPCLDNPANTCARTHAFTYDLATGTTVDIGTLPGGVSSEATDVNDAGLVVGSSLVTGPGGTTTHPFTYDPATATLTDLGTLPSTTSLRATAVNDDGVIVGNIGGSGAWLYDPGDGSLEVAPDVDRLNDINDHGMAVGTGTVPTGDDEFDNPLPGFVIGSIRTQVEVTPAPPTLLLASSCNGSTQLAWTATPDTGYATSGITYRVRRDGTPIATVAATSHIDVGWGAGGTYTVETLNAAGASAPSVGLVSSCATGLAGTVTAAGTPVGGIDVRVYAFGSGPLAAKTTTAADGTYSINGLGPGSYQVRFSDAAGTYVIQWNGGVATRAEAPAVVVGSGAVTVDAALEAAGVLHGTVTDDLGPVAAIDVRVYPAGSPSAVAKTRTAADGTYSFPGLPPGSYQLRFSSSTGSHVLEWNGDAATQPTASPVLVSATASAVVDAVLDRAAVIGGQIRFLDPTTFRPLPAAGVNVRIYPVGAKAIAKTVTVTSGGWSVANLPAGSYQIRVDDPQGRFAGVGWLDDDEFDDNGFTTSFAQADIVVVGPGDVVITRMMAPLE